MKSLKCNIIISAKDEVILTVFPISMYNSKEKPSQPFSKGWKNLIREQAALRSDFSRPRRKPDIQNGISQRRHPSHAAGRELINAQHDQTSVSHNYTSNALTDAMSNTFVPHTRILAVRKPIKVPTNYLKKLKDLDEVKKEMNLEYKELTRLEHMRGPALDLKFSTNITLNDSIIRARSSLVNEARDASCAVHQAPVVSGHPAYLEHDRRQSFTTNSSFRSIDGALNNEVEEQDVWQSKNVGYMLQLWQQAEGIHLESLISNIHPDKAEDGGNPKYRGSPASDFDSTRQRRPTVFHIDEASSDLYGTHGSEEAVSRSTDSSLPNIRNSLSEQEQRSTPIRSDEFNIEYGFPQLREVLPTVQKNVTRHAHVSREKKASHDELCGLIEENRKYRATRSGHNDAAAVNGVASGNSNGASGPENAVLLKLESNYNEDNVENHSSTISADTLLQLERLINRGNGTTIGSGGQTDERAEVLSALTGKKNEDINASFAQIFERQCAELGDRGKPAHHLLQHMPHSITEVKKISEMLLKKEVSPIDMFQFSSRKPNIFKLELPKVDMCIIPSKTEEIAADNTLDQALFSEFVDDANRPSYYVIQALKSLFGDKLIIPTTSTSKLSDRVLFQPLLIKGITNNALPIELAHKDSFSIRGLVSFVDAYLKTGSTELSVDWMRFLESGSATLLKCPQVGDIEYNKLYTYLHMGLHQTNSDTIRFECCKLLIDSGTHQKLSRWEKLHFRRTMTEIFAIGSEEQMNTVARHLAGSGEVTARIIDQFISGLGQADSSKRNSALKFLESLDIRFAHILVPVMIKLQHHLSWTVRQDAVVVLSSWLSRLAPVKSIENDGPVLDIFQSDNEELVKALTFSAGVQDERKAAVKEIQDPVKVELTKIHEQYFASITHVLLEMMWNDHHPDVRAAATSTLATFKQGNPIYEWIIQSLDADDPLRRIDSLRCLASLGTLAMKDIPNFVRRFSDPYLSIQIEACKLTCILKSSDKLIVSTLLDLLDSRDDQVRAWAIKGM